MRGWGLPTDLAAQIRLSIRSFLLVHTLRTHPPVFPAPMKRLSRPLILTVQSCERLSALDHICIFIAFTFSTSFFLFISFYIICFSNPSPPTRPSSSYTLGSELTWAPGTIFSLSQCLPLVCAGARELRDVPTAHSAHFLSPNMVKKKKEKKKNLQPDPTAEKVIPPLLSGMLLI